MFWKMDRFENFITQVIKAKFEEKEVSSIYLRCNELRNNTFCPGTRESKNFVKHCFYAVFFFFFFFFKFNKERLSVQPNNNLLE